MSDVGELGAVTDRPIRPEPYLIVPCDDLERIGGKPTLLTNYHIDEIIKALRSTTYDPDLLKKMLRLREAE